MFFWFLGTSLVAVWFVFRDPALPRTTILIGSILPDLVDGVAWRGAGVAHSLGFSVALLFVVMMSSIGRRPRRKKWLGLAIGAFLHLVFDGAWNNAALFWWPLGRTRLGSRPLPSFDRPLWLTILMELAGLAMLRQTFGLYDGSQIARPVPTC